MPKGVGSGKPLTAAQKAQRSIAAKASAAKRKRNAVRTNRRTAAIVKNGGLAKTGGDDHVSGRTKSKYGSGLSDRAAAKKAGTYKRGQSPNLKRNRMASNGPRPARSGQPSDRQRASKARAGEAARAAGAMHETDHGYAAMQKAHRSARIDAKRKENQASGVPAKVRRDRRRAARTLKKVGG